MKFYRGPIFLLALVVNLSMASGQSPPAEKGTLRFGDGESHNALLGAGVLDSWSLDLLPGTYVEVAVSQPDSDLALLVVTPGGQAVKAFNAVTPPDTETARWIADVSGVWRIQVASPDPSTGGSYRITWAVSKRAGERERQIVEADDLTYMAQIFLQQGDVTRAEANFDQAIAKRQAGLGPEHPDVAVAMTHQGLLMQSQRRFGSAEALFQEALRIFETNYGGGHITVARASANLGLLRQAQGQYREAEPYLERALSILTAEFGENGDVAVALNNLAALYYQQGRYALAEPLYRRALRILDGIHGADHPDVVTTLNNLAVVYFIRGNYLEAEPLFERIAARRERLLGPRHPDFANAISNLASVYRSLNKLSQAEPLARGAVEILEASKGPDHPDVASMVSNLGVIYQDQGRYSRAEALFARALDTQVKILGNQHPDLGTYLNNLAGVSALRGRYQEAEALYLRALRLREQALGPDHPDVATSLANLAGVQRLLGRYSQVEELSRRALTIRERAFGNDHPEVARSLTDLATLYSLQDRHNEAEVLLRRSLRTMEKVLGPEHSEIGVVLVNLGQLYVNQSNYELAESLYLRAIEIFERGGAAPDPSLATTLDKLGELYSLQSRYEQAGSLFERALEIRRVSLGSEHPDVAVSLLNLAITFREQKQLDQADSYSRQALKIRETQLGPDHPEVAVSLIHQASLALEIDSHSESEAIALTDRAIRLLEKTAAFPQGRAAGYVVRARLRKAGGNLDQAIDDLAYAIESLEKLRPGASGSEESRARHFGQFRRYYSRMVDWQVESGSVGKAFEYAERSKARTLLDQLSVAQVDLRAGIEPELREDLQRREQKAQGEIAQYQQQIQAVAADPDIPPEEQRAQITRLRELLSNSEAQYQQLYEEIKSSSPLWQRLVESSGKVVSTEVAQRLVPDQGILLAYHLGTENSFLFLIPPEGKNPQVFALQVDSSLGSLLGLDAGSFSAADLVQLLAGQADRRVTSGRIRTVIALPDLTHALWQILIPESARGELLSASEVTIIPDGLLHLLPFESLAVRVTETAGAEETASYWVEEGPFIRYAPSVTVLQTLQANSTPNPLTQAAPALVLSLSDPIYRPDGDEQSSDQQKSVELSATRGVFERAAGGLIRLPGTAMESSAIQEAFGGQFSTDSVTVLQQMSASEESLRRELPGKRFLHVATHGLVAQGGRSLFSALALTPPTSATPDPANDGFLQLHEIYDLDLQACELAVLSACETNVGELLAGEGVFALSRGFLAAGAQRVVASQWPVDDESTARLMQAFFSGIAEQLANGGTPNFTKALRDAKLVLRRNPKWADPYYWAPFVLIGAQ